MIKRKKIVFDDLVTLVRTGTPIEINGATYVAKEVKSLEEYGCYHCDLFMCCPRDVRNVCRALDTESHTYNLERYEDNDD